MQPASVAVSIPSVCVEFFGGDSPPAAITSLAVGVGVGAGAVAVERFDAREIESARATESHEGSCGWGCGLRLVSPPQGWECRAGGVLR